MLVRSESGIDEQVELLNAGYLELEGLKDERRLKIAAENAARPFSRSRTPQSPRRNLAGRPAFDSHRQRHQVRSHRRSIVLTPCFPVAK